MQHKCSWLPCVQRSGAASVQSFGGCGSERCRACRAQPCVWLLGGAVLMAVGLGVQLCCSLQPRVKHRALSADGLRSHRV